MSTKLKQYFTGETLDNVAKQLSSPELSHTRDKAQVDALVMELVIKYALRFVGEEERDPRDIQGRLVEPLVNAGQDEANAVVPLFDFRTTAAIVREIIFPDRSRREPNFLVTDLGSGSGILLLAGIIAGQRSQAQRVYGVGVEKVSTIADRSREVVSGAASQLPVPTEVCVAHENIFSSHVQRALSRAMPDIVISETFGHQTPSMEIKNGGVVLLLSPAQALAMAMSGELERQRDQFDPFPQVLDQLLETYPDLEAELRAGRGLMFPDVINGCYVSGPEPTLQLRTGVDPTAHIPLDQVGDHEFGDFEVPFYFPRFPTRRSRAEMIRRNA